ncbi:hypothetical protein KKH43_05920 [Patescibacteria group bacterium]|nr:hypothetical protein [Patescibacteria group bacterium]
MRFNTNIDRFLDWKIQNTNLSKAEYIRINLLKLIADDRDYQDFLTKFS